MRTLSKGVPQFSKMTERKDTHKIYSQFTGKANLAFKCNLK